MKIKHLFASLLLGASLLTGLDAAVLHQFDFNDTAGTALQSALNTGTVGGAFSAFSGGEPGNPGAITTGAGTLRLTYNGTASDSRLTTGLMPVPTEETVYQMVTIAGWNMPAPDVDFGTTTQPQVRISFINAPAFENTQIASELRFTRQSNGDVIFAFVTGTSVVNLETYSSVQNDALSFVTEFDRPSGNFNLYQLQPDDSWLPIHSGTIAQTGGVTRDALSTRIWVTGAMTVDGTGFFDLEFFQVATTNPIPEPPIFSRLTLRSSRDLQTWTKVNISPAMINPDGTITVGAAGPEVFFQMAIEPEE